MFKGKEILKYEKIGYIEFDGNMRISYIAEKYPNFIIK